MGYRTLSIHDLDGSVTGIPDSHIMLNDGENDSVVTDDSCAIHPTWNASLCARGDVGRLNLSDSRGELPATVNIETRTARFAFPLFDRWKSSSRWRRSGRSSCSGRLRPGPQAPIALVPKWQGISHHRQPEHCACRHRRDPGEDRKTAKSLSVWPKWTRGHGSCLSCRVSPKQPPGTEQPPPPQHMDALRKANATSYFRGGDALWVKLVVKPGTSRCRLFVQRICKPV